MAPTVSVIMPVYNAGSYLREAIESILNQTFADFELLILNDGSTDGSAQVIASYQDPRIKAIDQDNQGLRATLNTGIRMSTGKYIARMDQDDLSLPERLQKQVDFLETHPQHVLVGTTYAYVDVHGKVIGAFPALLEDADIKRELLTKSSFGHGTVMFRSSALRAGSYWYDTHAKHVEDYDLWLRFAVAGKFANLPDVLYLWRESPTNTTSENWQHQHWETKKLQEAAFIQQGNLDLLQLLPWGRLWHYKNNEVTVNHTRVRVQRRNAYASMYLVLAWLFCRHRKCIPAAISSVYALLVSPNYVVKALLRRYVHSA